MATNEPGSTRTTPAASPVEGFLFMVGGALNVIAATLLAIPVIRYVFSSFRRNVARSRGSCSVRWKIFLKIRPGWRPIAIPTPDPGMARQRTSRVGCGGSRGRSFRSSRSIARISDVRCAGSKSPLCSCVPATAACIMKMALALPARRRAGSTNMNTRLSRGDFGCGAGSCRRCRSRFEASSCRKDS